MASRLERMGDWRPLAQWSCFNAKTLAATCNISPRQLERYCQEKFRCSPQRWLNELRLQEAQRRLLQGLTVKETALALGFKQTSHFCREFKRYCGTPPNAFTVSPAVPGKRPVALYDHKCRSQIT